MTERTTFADACVVVLQEFLTRELMAYSRREYVARQVGCTCAGNPRCLQEPCQLCRLDRARLQAGIAFQTLMWSLSVAVKIGPVPQA